MKSRIIVVAALVILAIPAICTAIPARPGAYVSGFLGVSLPRDSNVTTSDLINNATFNDQVEFDPGLSIGGTGGYDFGFIRTEGELSYKYAEIATITEDTGFRFRNPDGNLGALALMFNAFFDLHNESPVTPYFGGGIGFATLHLSNTFGVDTGGGVTQRVLLYPSDDTTVFAYQAGAGLEIAIHRKLSLDVGYRYFGTAKGTFDKDITRNVDLNFESHNVALGVRVKF